MLARASAAACLAVACGVAAQQPASPPNFAPANLSPAGVRAMAANCASCHGTDGNAAPGSAVASLAARRPGDIAQSMALFREGKKPATVMHQIAKGFTDEETQAMDAYFSRQMRRDEAGK